VDLPTTLTKTPPARERRVLGEAALGRQIFVTEFAA
jgi:hypothetical protein